MAKTLNKLKSYGTVCGGTFKYSFTQDHKFFNSQGDEVTESGKLVKDIEAEEAKKAEAAKAEEEAKKAEAAKIQAAKDKQDQKPKAEVVPASQQAKVKPASKADSK